MVVWSCGRMVVSDREWSCADVILTEISNCTCNDDQDYVDR